MADDGNSATGDIHRSCIPEASPEKGEHANRQCGRSRRSPATSAYMKSCISEKSIESYTYSAILVIDTNWADENAFWIITHAIGINAATHANRGKDFFETVFIRLTETQQISIHGMPVRIAILPNDKKGTSFSARISLNTAKYSGDKETLIGVTEQQVIVVPLILSRQIVEFRCY